MLIIQILGEETFTWDEDDQEWVGPPGDLLNLLNETIPFDRFSVSTPFEEGGNQKYVLEAAQEIFKQGLTVLKNTPPDVPPEIDGVVY
jgi:hypothetical protein